MSLIVSFDLFADHSNAEMLVRAVLTPAVEGGGGSHGTRSWGKNKINKKILTPAVVEGGRGVARYEFWGGGGANPKP